MAVGNGPVKMEFSSGVKAKAMEQMKRISAKYESEWMNKPLNSNLHPIFQMLQSKDPLSDLEKFLSENDIRLVFISPRKPHLIGQFIDLEL